MFKIAIAGLLLPALIHSLCGHNLCNCVNSACSSCVATFAYLSSQSVCLPCPYQCRTCNQDGTTCTTCRDRYQLTSGKCELCPQHCLNCDNQCTKCENGYALSGGTCTPCSQTNALTCQTPDLVSTCKVGFWKNGNSCSTCRQFCLVCSSPSNCLECQPGYKVLVSFGSYCSSCSSGCKSCSSGQCTQCFVGFRLSGGVCSSISGQCNQITNCAQCLALSNGGSQCYSCQYPYYIDNGSCKLGASLLCSKATGPMYYECLESCGSGKYQEETVNSGLMCLPQPWMSTNKQVYLNAFSQEFSGLLYATQAQYVAYNQSNSQTQTSKLELSLTLQPYYKLTFLIKLVTVNLENRSIDVNFLLSDQNNNSDTYSVNQTPNLQSQSVYLTTSTQRLQGSQLSLKITTTVSQNIVPIIGISEILIQVYQCPNNCAICFNGQLCGQCQLPYFLTPQYQCVTACSGYIQLDLPTGDPNNHTHRECVLECPSTFYTLQINETYYRCGKCQGLCVTCLSTQQCLSCSSPYLYYEINYSCIATCPTTHYQSNGICTPCVAPCSTCLNQTSCLSCSIGYHHQGQCLSDCVSGTYINQNAKQCSVCHSDCISCTGSATFCQSCNSPFLLHQSQCLTQCPSSLFYPEGQVCQACVSPCLACNSSTLCLSCSVGYLFNASCLSTCPQAYFASTSDSTCKACELPCLTCLSSTICLSCPNSTNLYGYSCLSECPATTYPDNNVCLNCLLPCSSCLSQSQCVTCSIGYLSQVTPYTCLTSCQQGYYQYDLNSSCQPCSSTCATCQGTAHICLSCSNGRKLQGQSCLQQCLDGYYDLNGVCYGCSYPCLNCEVSDFTCTQCYSSFILINQSCITACPTGLYLNNATCQPCISPCLTCSSTNQCLSCVSGYFLKDDQCLTFCPATTFANSVTNTCQNCAFPCLQCQSTQKCLSCLNGFFNPYTQTCQICSGLYFSNQTSQQCQLCSDSLDNCSECSSSTQCLRCQDDFLLSNSSCITQGQCLNLSGSYVQYSLRSCLVCIWPCLACLNQSYCESCQEGYLLNGQCLNECPNSFFINNTQCLSCEFPCLTCTTSTSCTSCNQSSTHNTFYSLNSTCVPSSYCTSTLYIGSLSPPNCLSCSSPCLTCLNRTYCLSCSQGILHLGSCLSICPNGYFPTSNASFALCEACSSTCFKCTDSAFNCISCQAPLYLQSNTCVSQCHSGYYLDTTLLQCFACVLPCLNCSSLSVCTACLNSSHILYTGQCLRECPDGTYHSNSTCMDCPSSCLTCTLSNSSVLCTHCNNNMFMVSNPPGTCVNSCQITEYGDTITRNCYACIAPCASCSGAVSCLSCEGAYLLYEDQCLNITRCPTNSFLLNQTCLKQCENQLWGDGQTATCTTDCLSPKLRRVQGGNQQCLISCPSGYRVSSNYTCTNCNATDCSNLLSISLQDKNIFNLLYLKIRFTYSVDLAAVNPATLQALLPSSTQVRLLSTLTNISFSIERVNMDALWLRLEVPHSLTNTDLTITFSDYYVINGPLQTLSHSITIPSFDYYTQQERQAGAKFQYFGQIISVVLLMVFGVNLLLNSGYLSYSLIDYYQLLFMLLFLDIDFPPALNHFLYGFRYSHYLFLPQVFRPSSSDDTATNTPDKFGAVVPDVRFLSNAGPALLVVMVTVCTVLLAKLIEVLTRCRKCCTKNQVADEHEQVQGRLEDTAQSMNGTIQSKQEENKEQVGCLGRCMGVIVRRFKWNYANDVIYSIYFSVMVFAFSQLYDLQLTSTGSLPSIFLAFLSIILGIVLPPLITFLLKHNQKELITSWRLQQYQQANQQQKEDELSERSQPKGQQHMNNPTGSQTTAASEEDRQLMTAFKCFVGGMRLGIRLAFYHVPLSYVTKLITALLLVFCAAWPSLVLGVRMMVGLMRVILACFLRPYRLSFEQILYPLFDGTYVLVLLVVAALQLPLLDLTIEEKKNAGYFAICLCILLSLLLTLHSVVMNIVHIIHYFWGIDYLKQYQLNQYTTQSQFTEQQNPTPFISPKRNFIAEEGETQKPLQPMRAEELESKKESEDSDAFSGLDIYLKQETSAPQFLIKCAKIQPLSNKNLPQVKKDIPDQDESSEQQQDHQATGEMLGKINPIIFDGYDEQEQSNQVV